MHIPDSILDARVIATTVAVGALGLGVAVRRLDRRFGERSTVLMGTTAAFVFAAQMVTFPVGPGVSGHLLGGVLAAVLLGPWAGAVVIAAVLLVQCLMFADGGMTALGANFVNMGLIGSVGGYAIYAPIRRAIGGSTGILIAAMAAAWFSVLLASAACAVELAASGHQDQFLTILAWMALLHAVIGLGEALITGAVVRFLLVRRPDLFDEPDADSVADPDAVVSRYGRAKRWGEAIIGGLGVALAIAVFLAPFAYEQPDGLEFVGQKLELLPAEAPQPKIPAPIPDYQLPIAGASHVKLATAAAGLVGTLVVFAVGWGMARILPGTKQIEAHADAA
jgi:cobalt/nickel transport system permease protein